MTVRDGGLLFLAVHMIAADAFEGEGKGLLPFRSGARPYMRPTGSGPCRPRPRPCPLISTERERLVSEIEGSVLLISVGSRLKIASLVMTSGGAAKRWLCPPENARLHRELGYVLARGAGGAGSETDRG